MYVTIAITGLVGGKVIRIIGNRRASKEHTGNIKIRTVDILPRRLPLALALIRASNLSPPRLVRPWEKHDF